MNPRRPARRPQRGEMRQDHSGIFIVLLVVGIFGAVLFQTDLGGGYHAPSQMGQPYAMGQPIPYHGGGW